MHLKETQKSNFYMRTYYSFLSVCICVCSLPVFGTEQPVVGNQPPPQAQRLLPTGNMTFYNTHNFDKPEATILT